MKPKAKQTSLAVRVGRQLDRAIGVAAPGWAWKRAKLRLVTEAAFKLAKYQGADRGRLFGHWNPGGGSADADLLPDLSTLRERSRDLNRNDAIAAGITGTKVANDGKVQDTASGTAQGTCSSSRSARRRPRTG